MYFFGLSCSEHLADQILRRDPSYPLTLAARGVALGAIVATLAMAPAEAQPSLSYDEATVEVSGVVPGAEVAIFAVTRFQSNLTAVTAGLAVVEVDSDADGEISWTPGLPLVGRSFWAVSDLSVGGLALSWSEELDPVELTINLLTQLSAGPGGPNTRLDVELGEFSLFVARPGSGAWRVDGIDGGSADLGLAGDGIVSTDLSLAEAVDGSPAPLNGLQSGDLLFGASMPQVSYFAVEVGS